MFLNGVYTNPSEFSVSGKTLTFDTAPSDTVAISVVNYSTIPAPNVITRAQAVDEAITYSIALG